VSFIVFAFPVSCVAEWLAWITASDYVNRLNVSPVDLGDVA
jgi:CRISPR/Cas system CMR subunit Cmr4 (Cas7 group RAMP superfamily)